MDPVTHLREAAAILRRDGWTQYGLMDTTGAKCALGALGMTDHYLLLQLCESHETVRALATALGCAFRHEPDRSEAMGHYAARITGWNDSQDQTRENVLLTLEYAALLEEQRRALAQPSETPTEAT